MCEFDSRHRQLSRAFKYIQGLAVKVAAALIVAGLTGTHSRADEPAPAKLIMVVRVSGDSKPIDAKRLQAIIKTGLEKSSCRCKGDPQVNQISPTFYREFSKIVDLADRAPADETGGVKVTPVFAETNDEFPYIYDLSLDAEGQILVSLELKYSGGKSEMLTLAEKDRISKIGVGLDNKGQYRVKLPERPTNYLVTAATPGGKNQTIDEAWPQEDTHFAVTYLDFQGDWQDLRTTLIGKGKEKVPDPLKEILNVSDTRFLIAAIGREFGKSGPSIRDNLIIVREIADVQRGVTSIFVKLPLTLDELKSELDQFSELLGKDTIKLMRSQGASKQLPNNLAKTEDYPVLKQELGAHWYQLTKGADLSEFAGGFGLGDAENRKELRMKFPKMFMLVIQQNGEGDAAEAAPFAVELGEIDQTLKATIDKVELWAVPKTVDDIDIKSDEVK